MARKWIVRPTQDESREEALRPSRFLGYDRDSLGVYALRKEMYMVAESQFRRAVDINPYEPRFKQHLAWCLYKLGRYPEAKRLIVEALGQKPGDKDSVFVLSRIEERMGSHGARGPDPAHVGS